MHFRDVCTPTQKLTPTCLRAQSCYDQGGIKGEGAVPTQSPTQAFLPPRVSPKNTKSELPSLTCGTVRSTEQSKGFQQAEPQALPKGRYFQE